jgi:hypothetical protein
VVVTIWIVRALKSMPAPSAVAIGVPHPVSASRLASAQSVIAAIDYAVCVS